MKKEQFEQAFEQLFQPMIEKCIAKALDAKPESTVKDPDQWLTIGKAAKEFGCNQHLLRKAMVNLDLAYYQPEGRNVYIKRIDVYNYLESIKMKSKNDAEEYSFLKGKG